MSVLTWNIPFYSALSKMSVNRTNTRCLGNEWEETVSILFSDRTSVWLLLIYIWLCWVLAAAQAFLHSLWHVGSAPQLQHMGFSLPWLFLSRAQALGTQVSVVVAPGLQITGLAVATPRHVGSPWTREQICVSCVGRQTPHHWASIEALIFNLKKMCTLSLDREQWI